MTYDRVKQTWRIDSDRAWNPENQVRNYEDIASIFKSDPRRFTVSEERDEKGHFKSFTVST